MHRTLAWTICLLLLAVPAQAQFAGPLSIEAPTPPPPIEPDTGMAELVFPHVLHCDHDRAGLVAAKEVVVRHQVASAARGIIVTGDMSTTLETDACAVPTTTGIPFDVPFTVQVTQDVPGEMPIDLALTSSIETTPASPTAEATVPIQAAYFGLISVNVPRTVAKEDGGVATYDLAITNLGNSRATISFEATAGEGVEVEAPPQIVLESAAQGGTETEKAVRVYVRVGGDAGREATVQVHVTPLSTKDGTPGQGVTLNLLARDDSLLKTVASPGPALPLALLLVGLMARRRT